MANDTCPLIQNICLLTDKSMGRKATVLKLFPGEKKKKKPVFSHIEKEMQK